MLSRQQEEQDRIRTLRNDLSVREQQGRVFAQDQSLPNKASTLHQHALADADTPRGRFSAVETAYVVGSKADVAASYPAAAAHQHDPCGPEPPTGYRIDAMLDDEPSTVSSASFSSVETLGDPTSAGDAPSTTFPSVDVQRAGVGSPPINKFRRRV